jgi:hypothetical protein
VTGCAGGGQVDVDERKGVDGGGASRVGLNWLVDAHKGVRSDYLCYWWYFVNVDGVLP